MALEWLKTILGDKYTPEIDTAVSQEIGKGFVSRTDFNATSGKLKEAEAQVTQLTESVKTRDSQLEELKKSAGASEELQKQIETLTSRTRTKRPPMTRSWPPSSSWPPWMRSSPLPGLRMSPLSGPCWRTSSRTPKLWTARSPPRTALAP